MRCVSDGRETEVKHTPQIVAFAAMMQVHFDGGAYNTLIIPTDFRSSAYTVGKGAQKCFRQSFEMCDADILHWSCRE
jgi:hypothetical protein